MTRLYIQRASPDFVAKLFHIVGTGFWKWGPQHSYSHLCVYAYVCVHTPAHFTLQIALEDFSISGMDRRVSNPLGNMEAWILTSLPWRARYLGSSIVRLANPFQYLSLHALCQRKRLNLGESPKRMVLEVNFSFKTTISFFLLYYLPLKEIKEVSEALKGWDAFWDNSLCIACLPP